MATLLIIHEVEDVELWLSSPRRDELFTPLGITARPFRDPGGSNRVGLIAEVPDVAAWHEVRATSQAIEAMELDGLRRETIVELIEARGWPSSSER
ncbi:MAG: hypothetical protein WCB67_01305 [Solirubrobacteraceae bacterium]